MDRVLTGSEERWAAALGGAALFVWGTQRLSSARKASGAALVTTGAGLMWGASRSRSRRSVVGARGLIVEQAVAINRTPAELFGFWRSVEQLPRIFPELRSVRRVDHGRSEWTASGPGGRRLRWTADIINELRDEMIAWRTTSDSDLASAGSVHFDGQADGRGTVVRVKLQYRGPGGLAGAAVAWGAGDSPNQVVREGLRRFKQLMETGEIATTAGQPRGAR